jgi:ribonuclease III
MNDSLINLQKVIGYRFGNISLLEKAITHPSYVSVKPKAKSYERLEFLGDAVLGLIVSEYLHISFHEESEGGLAKRRAAVVCGESLAIVARKLNIGSFLLVSGSEESNGGRDNSANIENSLEAIIGAIYMDGGMEPARTFILSHFEELMREMSSPPKDPKTTLQEWAQARGYSVPLYETVTQEGPAHHPIFTIKVTVQDAPEVVAKGNSKKMAEREAAKKLLELLPKENNG